MSNSEMGSVRHMVDDVDEAIAYYTKFLDFELLTHPGPPFADVRRGNLRLLLAGPDSSAGDIVEGPGGKQILLQDPSGNVVELFQPAS